MPPPTAWGAMAKVKKRDKRLMTTVKPVRAWWTGSHNTRKDIYPPLLPERTF